MCKTGLQRPSRLATKELTLAAYGNSTSASALVTLCASTAQESLRSDLVFYGTSHLNNCHGHFLIRCTAQ